jgi:nucleoside-diphosphate-sugar epimerase
MSMSNIRSLVTGGTGFLGTNLVATLLATGREVLSVGRRPAKHAEQPSRFVSADITDLPHLKSVFRDFAPKEVIHLAAQTDFVTWSDPRGFYVNTEGTRHVIEASESSGAIRLIVASSHVVIRPEQREHNALNYAASKLAMEEVVKQANPSSLTWTIIRPCSIWGPWFGSPFREFFLRIARRKYFDLGQVDPPKRLGFVGNICFQISSLLDAPAEEVHGRTIYLADYETTTIRKWARLIAAELGVRPPRPVPEPVILAGARLGDLLQKFGYKNPPLTSFRLANMRTDTSVIPIDDIRSLAHPLPFTLEEGVKITVKWLRDRGLVR